VLLIVIPIACIAWLAIVTLVLAACTMAARGDRDMGTASAQERREVSEALQALTTVETPARRIAPNLRRRSLRGRGARGRGARSAAGS